MGGQRAPLATFRPAADGFIYYKFAPLFLQRAAGYLEEAERELEEQKGAKNGELEPSEEMSRPLRGDCLCLYVCLSIAPSSVQLVLLDLLGLLWPPGL